MNVVKCDFEWSLDLQFLEDEATFWDTELGSKYSSGPVHCLRISGCRASTPVIDTHAPTTTTNLHAILSSSQSCSGLISAFTFSHTQGRIIRMSYNAYGCEQTIPFKASTQANMIRSIAVWPSSRLWIISKSGRCTWHGSSSRNG